MLTRSPLLLTMFASLAFAGACASSSSDNGDDDGGARCGNQIVEAGEDCDDGNSTPNDGCNSRCEMEQIVEAVCGDGVVAQSEGCDDGATEDDDGCSASCSVETGYTCAGAPSVCTMMPSGANGTCASPFVIALAAGSNGDLTGSGTGDTSTGTSQIPAAPCDGGDPEPGAGIDHIWQFTLTDTRDVLVLMPSTVTFDAILRLQAAACDVGTEIPEYTGVDGCSDQSFEMDTEALAYVKLGPGTYYVVVDGFDAAAKGTYELQIVAMATTCGDGVLDLLEFCDDGDSASGDGCSAKCEVETGYTCDGEPSVCTMGGSGTAVPPAAGDLVINEAMLADNLSDTNCDMSTKNNADEFIELVNKSAKTLDLTGVTIDDAASLTGTLGPRHTFAAAASGSLTLAPGKAVVVWGAGSPACAGVSNWFVSSTGSLGLNDTGDTITVRTAGASPITIVEKTFAAGDVKVNISRTLSPDITGATYVDHPAIGARYWSPGRKADDSAF
jgi:cysteine-rich repeat protein